MRNGSWGSALEQARPGQPRSTLPIDPVRPDSPRVAPSRSTDPLRAAKVDRKGRPSVPETRFSTILGRFWKDFRRFSRLLRAIGATRSAKGRTSVFASRRSTLEGSQTLQKNQKLTKIVEKSVRRRFANEPSEKNSIFSLADATRRRFWSPRPSPERSRAPLWASRAVLGDSPGAPGARRGRSRDAPRRLWDVPERHWASRVGPGTDFKSTLGAPGMLRDRFWIDFRVDF